MATAVAETGAESQRDMGRAIKHVMAAAGGRADGKRVSGKVKEALTVLVARRQLELSNEVAAELAGAQDQILRTLEEHLDCAIYLRGNVVTLDGDADAVQAAATVVRELSSLVARGHELGPATIESVTRVLDERESPAQVLEDVVWRHRNLKVAPKSVNQKRYVDAIRRSTITFGVGPAGTGKTFLASRGRGRGVAQQVKRIVLCRPAVERGSASASSPATYREVDPYLRPFTTRCTTSSAPRKWRRSWSAA